jgi:hypothetical protein
MGVDGEGNKSAALLVSSARSVVRDGRKTLLFFVKLLTASARYLDFLPHPQPCASGARRGSFAGFSSLFSGARPTANALTPSRHFSARLSARPT